VNKYTHDVIIIGGGSGGLTATAGLAQLGLKTLLIEKERLGGDCLFYGCVPSKTLIKSARVFHFSRTAEKYGLPPGTLALPQASSVMSHIQDVINELIPHDSPERFRALGTEVLFGTIRFISPHELNLDGKIYSAPKIILSIGSDPRVPPIPGLSETDYLTNKTLFSLKEFPKSLAVIGGGPIGSEMGQALNRFGVKVSILEMSSHILSKDDEDTAGIIESALRGEGIDIRTNSSVEIIENHQGKNRIILGNGDSLDVDKVLVATGRKATLDDLDLEKAGIETERGFIKTNQHLATTQKHILAIGDCNGKYMFTHAAGAEGGLAVRKIAFHLPITMDYSKVPWCTFTDPELASVGLNETMAKAKGLSYRVEESPFKENDRALAEAETQGKIKTLIDKKGHILGIQIAGTHGGDLIGPALYAHNKRMKISQLMAPIFPYPTRGEIYRKVSGNYLSPKLFNPRVRNILGFLFGFRGN